MNAINNCCYFLQTVLRLPWPLWPRQALLEGHRRCYSNSSLWTAWWRKKSSYTSFC